ncbi:MAG: YhdH/YhfP family quinone oxidoreductase [Gammaproteobacteria bacterium]|nr:YhdH/YhfP family quinone oxidoreductase [Gammaproteobacteria bacterium]
MNSRAFPAWRVQRAGEGIEARLDRLTPDELSPGEIVIRAEYSSLNYKDALALSGRGKIMRHYPLVAGIDVAGRVETSDDPAFGPGDAVLVTGSGIGERTDGGFAGRVRVAAKHVIAIPSGLDTRSAMQLGTAGFTAALAIHRMEINGQAPGGGPILVTGASGGVGSLAVAMLAGRGYKVVAMSGKPEAQKWLGELGAEEIILSREADFGDKPLESARFAGALDTVGGDTLARLFPVIDWWGNVAAIGNAGGAKFQATVFPFILRGVSLLGINSMATPRALRETLWERLATDLKPAALDDIAGEEIALEQVMRSVELLMDGKGPLGRTLVHIP